jgi:hypothetical protein
MRGCIKRAMCNVNQMGEFWCFLPCLLRQEISLTRDVLNELYCNTYRGVPNCYYSLTQMDITLRVLF